MPTRATGKRPANVGAQVPPGLVIGRRELFTLFGAGLVTMTTACNGSSSPPIRAVSSSAGTTGGGAIRRSSASNAASSSAATPAPARIGGAHVGSGAITVSNAIREAGVANGAWRGGWHDSTGASGTSDITIAIDGHTRTARGSLEFTGPLIGAPVPLQVYEVDLLSFVLLAQSWSVDSPQFGTVTIIPGGDTEGSGSARNIPGHPEIASITAEATKSGRRVDLHYTIKHVEGADVYGSMAWSAAGTRATPLPVGQR